MNYTGIFDDLNYMSPQDFKDYMNWSVYKPIKLEFMDYVLKGMKNFLKSPFHHGVEWEYKGDL